MGMKSVCETQILCMKGDYDMQVVPYLYFDGNCEEAFEFYSEVFGGTKSEIMRYGDQGEGIPEAIANRVMHTELTVGDHLFYFSDTSGDDEWQPGTNVQINLNFDAEEEIRRIFAGLAVGANVTMELQETFWGAIYGALTDRYGVSWSFNHMLAKD